MSFKDIINRPERENEPLRIKYYKTMDLLCWLLLAAIFISVYNGWEDIPDNVIRFYSLFGEPLSYGAKGAVFIVPVIATVLYLALFVFEKYPQHWPTKVRISTKNFDKIVQDGRDVMTILKVVVCVFAILIFKSVFVGEALPAWLLPLCLALIAAAVIIFIVRMRAYEGDL